MKRTKEKDALANTYVQLDEIRTKIHSLLHHSGVDKKDVFTIAAMLRKAYLQLKLKSGEAGEQLKNGTLTF